MEHFAQTVKTKGLEPFYFQWNFSISKSHFLNEISQFNFHSFKGLLLIYPIYLYINPVLIRVYPHIGCGRIYPTLTAITPTPTLHLTWFMASSFSKPTLLLSFSTCIFHILFGRPCFLLPFTSWSISNAFLKTCPLSHLSTHTHTITLHLPLVLTNAKKLIYPMMTSNLILVISIGFKLNS